MKRKLKISCEENYPKNKKYNFNDDYFTKCNDCDISKYINIPIMDRKTADDIPSNINRITGIHTKMNYSKTLKNAFIMFNDIRQEYLMEEYNIYRLLMIAIIKESDPIECPISMLPPEIITYIFDIIICDEYFFKMFCFYSTRKISLENNNNIDYDFRYPTITRILVPHSVITWDKETCIQEMRYEVALITGTPPFTWNIFYYQSSNNTYIRPNHYDKIYSMIKTRGGKFEPFLRIVFATNEDNKVLIINATSMLRESMPLSLGFLNKSLNPVNQISRTIIYNYCNDSVYDDDNSKIHEEIMENRAIKGNYFLFMKYKYNN
jgi:hypothetical protein